MIRYGLQMMIGTGLFAGALVTQAAERPNIILMMTDDLGWGDVQAFNPKTPIKTPHLDAMAKAGVQFNRFYASSPVCSPTPGSSITGRHPFRFGIYYANTGHMKTEELTVTDFPAVTSDYLPAILDTVCAEYTGDRPLDVISLLPAVSVEMTERDKGIGFQSKGSETWSTQRYKICRAKESQRWELYGLIADPSEKKNLAMTHPKIVTELSKKFAVWSASCKQSDEGEYY